MAKNWLYVYQTLKKCLNLDRRKNYRHCFDLLYENHEPRTITNLGPHTLLCFLGGLIAHLLQLFSLLREPKKMIIRLQKEIRGGGGGHCIFKTMKFEFSRFWKWLDISFFPFLWKNISHFLTHFSTFCFLFADIHVWNYTIHWSVWLQASHRYKVALWSDYYLPKSRKKR